MHKFNKSNVLFLSLLIFISAVSCTNKKKKLSAKIYELEISDSSSTPKGMNDLAIMYYDYATTFPKDSISERYLFKGFMFKYITNHWDDAINYGNHYKSIYPVSEWYHSINLKLAEVYYKGKNNTDSAVHYYLLAEGKAPFSTDEKRQAASVLENWASTSTDSVKGATALFTAAKLHQMANDYTEAVRLYLEVANKYPSYEKSPDALMAAGFIYWDNLKETEKAKACYTQLIEKYPANPLAKEARTLLAEDILTMSDLELSEYLMKKNKEKAK